MPKNQTIQETPSTVARGHGISIRSTSAFTDNRPLNGRNGRTRQLTSLRSGNPHAWRFNDDTRRRFNPNVR